MILRELIGLVGRFAESTVLGSGRGYFGGLEQHLLAVFMHRVEELSQRLVFSRIELPHIERPSLTREDPAEEHDLDHVDKLDLLVCQDPDPKSHRSGM